MNIKPYNRDLAVSYAKKWAFSRNPEYYNFDSVGGDCTSFISQCIYAGSGVMNYSKLNGWYYKNGYDKSPSWSGVEFLYNFLVNNKNVGPFGRNVSQNEVDIGDVIQLSFTGNRFEHSTIIVGIDALDDLSKIFISSHTFDSFYKPISTYNFKKIRFIHIDNVRNF